MFVILGFGVQDVIVNADRGAGMWFALGFISTTALVLTLKTILHSSNYYAFRSSRVHLLLFAIRRKQPSAEIVDDFVLRLANLIGAYRTPAGLNPAELAEHFRKALQYMLENDVLTPAEHDAALKRLEERSKGGTVLELIKR